MKSPILKTIEAHNAGVRARDGCRPSVRPFEDERDVVLRREARVLRRRLPELLVRRRLQDVAKPAVSSSPARSVYIGYREL